MDADGRLHLPYLVCSPQGNDLVCTPHAITAPAAERHHPAIGEGQSFSSANGKNLGVYRDALAMMERINHEYEHSSGMKRVSEGYAKKRLRQLGFSDSSLASGYFGLRGWPKGGFQTKVTMSSNENAPSTLKAA